MAASRRGDGEVGGGSDACLGADDGERIAGGEALGEVVVDGPQPACHGDQERTDRVGPDGSRPDSEHDGPGDDEQGGRPGRAVEVLAEDHERDENRERRLEVQQQRARHCGGAVQAGEHGDRSQHAARDRDDRQERQIATLEASLGRAGAEPHRDRQCHGGTGIQEAGEQLRRDRPEQHLRQRCAQPEHGRGSKTLDGALAALVAHSTILPQPRDVRAIRPRASPADRRAALLGRTTPFVPIEAGLVPPYPTSEVGREDLDRNSRRCGRRGPHHRPRRPSGTTAKAHRGASRPRRVGSRRSSTTSKPTDVRPRPRSTPPGPSVSRSRPSGKHCRPSEPETQLGTANVMPTSWTPMSTPRRTPRTPRKPRSTPAVARRTCAPSWPRTRRQPPLTA